MIFHAAYGEREQIMVSADGRSVCPETWQKFGRQELLAVLCAEYKVNVVLCIAVGHVFWPVVMLHDQRCVAAYGAPACFSMPTHPCQGGLDSSAPPALQSRIHQRIRNLWRGVNWAENPWYLLPELIMVA